MGRGSISRFVSGGWAGGREGEAREREPTIRPIGHAWNARLVTLGMLSIGSGAGVLSLLFPGMDSVRLGGLLAGRGRLRGDLCGRGIA